MKGFTLVELMVVVIIIAILTAIALPQYQKAVEKSRAAEAVTLGKAIIDAQNRSLDAFPNDSVTTKSALDIKLDEDSTHSWSGSAYTTPDFTYTLQSNGVQIKRNEGSSMQYTLFMGNNDSHTANWCSGSICNSMAGMGFTTKTAIEHKDDNELNDRFPKERVNL